MIGPPAAIRILHFTDLHNRPSGVLLCRSLTRALRPGLVVNTGDLSGLGPAAEAALIGSLAWLPAPVVFVPGNHDSAASAAIFRSAGGCVLDAPAVCRAGGVRVWGYRDPNSTRLFRGRDYRDAACREAAARVKPPLHRGPLVAAVHNALMVNPHQSVPLVLSGHFHHPEVVRRGPSLMLRTGSTGGGGPFGGALHASVAEIDPDTYCPVSIWLIEVARGRPKVEAVDLAALTS